MKEWRLKAAHGVPQWKLEPKARKGVARETSRNRPGRDWKAWADKAGYVKGKENGGQKSGEGCSAGLMWWRIGVGDLEECRKKTQRCGECLRAPGAKDLVEIPEVEKAFSLPYPWGCFSHLYPWGMFQDPTPNPSLLLLQP